jgi:two-component system osmolarity sensor histidine kinase EnvZ
MTSLDVGIARLRSAAIRVSDRWSRFNVWFRGMMPKGLYARALLIIIAPMVILQSVVAFVFMERHWNLVTRHLSAAVVGDIAAVMEIYKNYPQEPDNTRLKKIAQSRLGPSHFSRCSTSRCLSSCASRSAGRSGSTLSAARRWSRFASSSMTR